MEGVAAVRTPEQRERQARLKREREASRRAAGLCVLCAAGLTDDRAGMRMCVECGDAHNARQRADRQRNRDKRQQARRARWRRYYDNQQWREAELMRIKIWKGMRP